MLTGLFCKFLFPILLTIPSSQTSQLDVVLCSQLVKNIEQEKDTIPLVRTLLEMFGAVASEMLRADLLKAVSGMMRVYRARSRIRYRKGIQGHDLKWPAGEMVLQAIPPLLQSMGQDSFLLRSIVVDVSCILTRLVGLQMSPVFR